jgi:hypothetical protein
MLRVSWLRLSSAPSRRRTRPLLILETLEARDLPAPVINTFAGNGSPVSSGDGGSALNAGVFRPFGVAIDTAGGAVVFTDHNNRIREVNPSGIITTLAGNGISGFSGDGGPATAAELGDPSAVAADAQGNIFIADTNNNRIREVTTNGIIITVAGNGTAGFLGDGGRATAAELNSPGGVVVDAAGNLYIADSLNNVIRKVTPAGIITTVAGNGTAGFSGDGGPATKAQLHGTSSVAVDGQGDLFIADFSNNVIREVNTAGIISTIAGNGTVGFSGDGGPATDAQLDEPEGVAVDAFGNVFIGDALNNRVRQVTPSGTISTLAGNGSQGFSGDGGAPASASLFFPQGLAVDSSDDVFIADSGNNRIRIITGLQQQPPPPTSGQLAFATQPSTVVPGQLISPAVTVLVEDTNGNVITSNNSIVTIAIGANPGGALLGGTTSVQAVNGRATFTGLNLSTFGSGFTLVASASSFGSAMSQPFNVNPITITATTNVNLVNQPVTFNIKAFAPQPSGGHPFGTVTLSLSDGTVLGTVPVNSNGRATFTTSSLPLSSGSSTTANVITALYNDPASASTTVTTVATSGPGVPVTVVLGPGASPAGAGTLTDGSGPGTLAGVVQTNSPLVGQFVPATDTLVPNFGDDNLFTLAAGSSPDQVNLLTNFTTDFQQRPSFTVEVKSDIGIGSPVMQVFTLFVIASPPPPGTGGGVVHGASTLAVFDPTGISNAFTAFWYLGTANAANAAPTVVPYGGNTWKGVLGDWTGKGFDSLGVVDTTGRSTPGAAVWYLRNTNTPGAPDIGPFFYGLPTWTPIVGDWNGDGITTVGAVDTATGTWYLRNENSNGAPDQGVFVYGEPGWIPLAGDWTGSGHTGIGMFDPSTATFYLRNSASTGAPDFVITYGAPGWKPVVGDWDGNGTTTIAVVAPGNIWYIRNSNSAGAPDVPPFPFGLDVWTPASGRFLSPGTPEIVAGGARVSDPSTQVLSTAQLQEAVSAALTLLQQVGVDPLLIARLASADYEVGTLPGALLGVTTADGRIIVSANAAGYGWSGLGSPSAGQMDLLTVVLHEMTHLAGQPDEPGSGTSGNLLADTLAPGVRRTDGLDAFFAGAQN